METSLLSPNDLAGLATEEFIESRLILYDRKTKNWKLKYGPLRAKDFKGLPSQDWTLLVQDVDKHLPAVADLVAKLDFLPHAFFDDVMVSYAVEGGSVGAHIDRYHVFLVQVAGSRRWQIEEKKRTSEDLIPNIDLKLLKTFRPTKTCLAEPGDVLYLPPGLAHHGVSLDKDCMTFSFGLRAPSIASCFLPLRTSSRSRVEEMNFLKQKYLNPVGIPENLVRKA